MASETLWCALLGSTSRIVWDHHSYFNTVSVHKDQPRFYQKDARSRALSIPRRLHLLWTLSSQNCVQNPIRRSYRFLALSPTYEPLRHPPRVPPSLPIFLRLYIPNKTKPEIITSMILAWKEGKSGSGSGWLATSQLRSNQS